MATLYSFNKQTTVAKNSVGGDIVSFGHFLGTTSLAAGDTIGPLYVQDLETIINVSVDSKLIDTCSTAAGSIDVGHATDLDAFIANSLGANSGAFKRHDINVLGLDSLGNATIGAGYTYDRSDTVTGGTGGYVYITVKDAPTNGNNGTQMTLRVTCASDVF